MNTPDPVSSFWSKLKAKALWLWSFPLTRWFIIGLVVGFLLCRCNDADAATGSGNVTLAPPTTRADGSPLAASEIASYNVRCSSFKPTGGTSGACTFTALVIPGDQTGGVIMVTFTADGTACFEGQTVDTGGRLSAWTGGSGTACKLLTVPKPGGPGVTVAVVIGINVAPVYTFNDAGVRSQALAGLMAVGLPCKGAVVFNYRSRAWRRVNQADVGWWKTTATADVAAPCA